MTTFRDLLESSTFSSFRMLTDHTKEDLERDVSSIEITETPDIAFHIPENIVLLTTAMVFKDNQKGMIPLIDSLLTKNTVALGIKTGRFLNRVDPEVIAYANSVDFPIFEIPGRFNLGAVLHEMTNLLWKDQKREILFALDIQKRFSDLLLSGATIQDILVHLGDIIKTPTVLLDPFYEPVAASRDFEKGGYDAEEIATDLREEQELTGRKADNFTLKSDLNTQVLEVNPKDRYPYLLVILYPESMPYPISQFATDQAVLVLSFALFRNGKVQESEEMAKTSKLYDLFTILEETEDIDKRWLRAYTQSQLIDSDYYQIIQIHLFDEGELSEEDLSSLLSLIHVWLNKHLKDFFEDAVLYYNKENDGLILILQHQADQLTQDLTDINDRMETDLDQRLIFSVGLPVNELMYLHRSFNQSSLARDQRSKYHDHSSVVIYENTGPSQLFSQLDKNGVRYFCESVLKDFAYPEESYLKDLRKTLTSYLDHQCEITATAEDLFIHRNTVKYRIERCEEILGRKVDSPENSLSLRLALKLSEVQ